LKEAGIVTEAQFIMGLENETKETIEETYRLALDWKPDMANWNMYTPWPFAELFEELGDRVEVRDYAKYNFVTPIIQPDGMKREDVLKGVLRNYGRFYMRKAFFEYLFVKDGFKRRYLLGCLKAFVKTTATKKFYDLERLKVRGMRTDVDFGFDPSKVLDAEAIARQKSDLPADVNFLGGSASMAARSGSTSAVSACGPPPRDTSAIAAKIGGDPTLIDVDLTRV